MVLAAPPQATPVDEPRFSFNPVIDLHWKVWGQACVVFESVSGETAAIDSFDGAVLATFSTSRLTMAELAKLLASDLGVDDSEALHARVAAALSDFVARGWLEVHTAAA